MIELKQNTIDALERHGHDTLDSYLTDLDEINGLPNGTALELFSILGETELFDGLVTMLEDYYE